MTRRATRYQRTHRPTRVVEVRCTNREPLDENGFCPACGRHLAREGRDHKPNRTGSLGYVEHFADGSTRKVDPS